ncbi:beta-N-acetylhexosaminidase [Xinfangfangia sp. D13-10-4-6]|uniref:beta-N-acetylhexosaminidase n=1 Tax=Pseudogemmobacter hezensis TaxID=2737662 RepID=UPI0015541802|nr:beta-N-acetylhexosaminidase [Pseudogemmobacter hezensis]NPD16158.1 beta-N-acetylhexosaminidase [Pseudogemmobacter hezensis]
MSGSDVSVQEGAAGAGAAIFGTAGPELLPQERDFFRDYNPFGFILFARNVEDPAQLSRLTAELREAVGRDAPILIDQEGGRVQRMRAPHWREWLPPLDLIGRAASPEDAARLMEIMARLIASELRAVGIDANCAPVADVARADTHPFLKNRCYGTGPEAVARIARAVADGYLAGGVLPVMKHMPGHGLARQDTHLELPRVTTSRAELAEVDFWPFTALADLPMAMTAHIVFTEYDPLHPATQSAEMVRVIRHEIGFKGLLMTDDLNMEALSGSLDQRTSASMQAGCDIALHCKGDMRQMIEVARAAGDMTPAARSRALAALACRTAPAPVDIPALEAEFQALSRGSAG